MKITMTRGELRNAVSGFSKIIPSKTGIAVLGCVRFYVEGGDLKAQATDLDQTLVYRFDNAEVGGSGEIIVPFPAIKELARGDASDTVCLEQGGDKVTVTNSVGGHEVTSTAEGPEARDWPESGPEIPVQEAKGFLKAYRRMAPFASADETRRTLQCVYVDVSGTGEHNATLVATDGRRLCCCNSLSLPVDDEHGVMVPVTKFLLWNGLAEDVQMGVSKTKSGGRVCVRSGPWTYLVKSVDGQYPNWRQVVPVKDGMAHTLTFTDADAEAMTKIVPALPGKEAVGIEGGDGRVTLRGQDGDRQVRVPLTAGSAYAGSGCGIIVNRFYLLDMLRAGFRNFMFADQVSPLLSDDGKGAKHVLMPLRYDGPPRQQQPAAATSAAAAQQDQAETANDNNTPPTATVPPADLKEAQQMKQEQTTVQQEMTALERLQAAYDVAKAKVRDAQSALADVAAAIRDAVKEERKRNDEVAAVRAGLAKLQSIKV